MVVTKLCQDRDLNSGRQLSNVGDIPLCYTTAFADLTHNAHLPHRRYRSHIIFYITELTSY